MPIYEYRCPHCGETFEKLVPMGTDAKQVECPCCGQKGVDKKVSVFGTSGGDSWGGFSAAQGASCSTSGGT
jgi:putative FmdB family regulatory protein